MGSCTLLRAVLHSPFQGIAALASLSSAVEVPPLAREAHITVRLESQDKFLIQLCASSAGLSLSEWIRQTCVRAALTPKRKLMGSEAPPRLASEQDRQSFEWELP